MRRVNHNAYKTSIAQLLTLVWYKYILYIIYIKYDHFTYIFNLNIKRLNIPEWKKHFYKSVYWSSAAPWTAIQIDHDVMCSSNYFLRSFKLQYHGKHYLVSASFCDLTFLPVFPAVTRPSSSCPSVRMVWCGSQPSVPPRLRSQKPHASEEWTVSNIYEGRGVVARIRSLIGQVWHTKSFLVVT